MLEDDIGMLWLEPDRLLYRGDAEAFEITRDELPDIERVVVSASPTAYVGKRHIVLRFKAVKANGEYASMFWDAGPWNRS